MVAFPERMKFGIFLAPFHPPGENPTLALERDLELVQWLDALGFDEAWVGEHHSGGWETITSPEIFIAAAAERTRNIKLGTGVISLPYHHPLMVADRMVLLDHLTRGRVMMGVGPGAMVSDGHMMGIDYTTQRERMDESLGVILRLFTGTEPVTHHSDWFELNDGILQLRPYQSPHMPIAVASSASPAGVALAGKHGAAVLSVGVPPAVGSGAKADLSYLWSIAEESAAEHEKTVKRDDWRLVITVHLAESREEAINDARAGAGHQTREYTNFLLGPNPATAGPIEKIIDTMVEAGSWIIGTPDDCVEAINRLGERSGGFGGLLVQHQEWVSREKMLRSFELLARYVMPQFQGSLAGPALSYQWSVDHWQELLDLRRAASDKASRAWQERTR